MASSNEVPVVGDKSKDESCEDPVVVDESNGMITSNDEFVKYTKDKLNDTHTNRMIEGSLIRNNDEEQDAVNETHPNGINASNNEEAVNDETRSDGMIGSKNEEAVNETCSDGMIASNNEEEEVSDSSMDSASSSMSETSDFGNISFLDTESKFTSDEDDLTFLKGDSIFDSISNSSSDEDSEDQFETLIVPILGEHLNILQNGAIAIPTIINILSQSTNDSMIWGGSRPGKSPNKERDFELAYERITKDYFSGDDSTYNEQDFERRFRLPRNVFDTIYNKILGKSIFIQRKDAANKLGIHPLCRFVACIRYLAYGGSFDSLDEYCRLSESSIHKSVKAFTKLLIQEFGEKFLNRSPTDDECNDILKYNEMRGFPGMLASWDCTHFSWKKCPVALHGQFKGRKESKTLVLEAVVDCDLRFWFINFGRPGSLSDLNILHQSSIVRKLLSHDYKIKTKSYTINNTIRDYMYFLVDGIYPPWSIFVPTIKIPRNNKEKLFSKQQEGCRKDVERVFACLSQKFQILQKDIRLWYIPDIADILKSCIILHNMCVVDRIKKVGREQYHLEILSAYTENNNDDPFGKSSTIFQNNQNLNDPIPSEHCTALSERIFSTDSSFRDVAMHDSLMIDLVENLWENRQFYQLYNPLHATMEMD